MLAAARSERNTKMEELWEAIDGLSRTVHSQGKRLQTLETSNAELERRLAELTERQTSAPAPNLAHLQPADRRAEQHA